MDMHRVLLRIEEPPFPQLDHALLEVVAEACERIGSNITAAFEGEQRRVFQDLCLQIAGQGVQYQPVPDAARSNVIPLVALSTLVAGCLFGRRSPRLLYRRIHGTARRN